MHFIDTHAHLYAAELTSDLDMVMKNSLANGIDKIIMPAIDSSSLDAMLKVEQQFPENCIAMMGLHPCYVKKNYKEELTPARKDLIKKIQETTKSTLLLDMIKKTL